MEDNRRKLYDALSQEYDLGTFEQFSADIQDAGKRKKLYDATINDYDFGDYDSFSSQLGFVQHAADAYEGLKNMTAKDMTMPVDSATLPTENRNQDIFAGRESMARYADKAQNLRKAQAAYNMSPTAENADQLDFAASNFSDVETSRLNAEKEKRTKEELLAERKRLEDAKKEAELRLRTRRGEIASPSGMYQMGMAPVTGNQAAEITDPEMTKLYAAVNSYDNAIRSVDRKLSSGEEPGFWEGVADATVRNPGFYTMGLTDMSDARGMLNIAQNGVEGREDELLADALYSKSAEQQDEDFGFLYRAGNIFGHSVPFMVQTAVTGGFSGASRAGANLAGRLGKKAAEGTIKKKIINAMGTTIDDVIEAGLIANTAGAGGTWANIAERKAGKINIKDGDYVFENGESWLGALYKGEVSSILEFYTEKIGGHLEGKLSLTKGLDKIGASRVSNVLLAAKNSDLYKGASTVMRQFGLNGYLTEVLEEEANLVLNSLLVGDNSLSELYNPKTQLDIFGGMLLTVGTMQAIPGTIAIAGYVKNQYQMSRADRRAADVFGEDWEAVKEALDNATNEKVAGVVSENLRDNENQNKALLDYYKRMMIMRGYNIGTVKNETAPEVEEAYTDGFSQEPTGANALNAMSGYDMARQEVARALGLAEGDDVDVFINGGTAEDIAKGDTDVENAVKNYQQQKARMEGIQEKFQQTREQQYEESDRSIDKIANHGVVYSTKYDGQNVYITGGTVVLDGNGMVSERSSDALYVLLPNGSIKTVAADRFTNVVTAELAETKKTIARQIIDAEWKAEFDTAEVLARQQEVEQEKRDSGVVFDMTDPEGTHRVEILNEGNSMADILLDGKEEQIPTEELNRWKQEAGIQSADAVADNTTDNVAPTGDNVAPVENNEPASVELPNVPDFFRLNGTNYEVDSRNDDGSVDVMVNGKRETLPAGTDYSTLMPTDKKGEVQYEKMPVERTHEYFVQRVTNDKKRAEMIDNNRKKAEAERKKFDKEPDAGLDPDKWEEVNRKWEEGKKAAQAKVDYWKEVGKREAEITRSEIREAVDNIKPDVMEETADEFIANQLAGIKITPESFKRETGLSNAEQAQLVGVISNDGVSVERAAEIILENYDSELAGMGFTGDVQDVRDIIISVLSQGNPRSYAKRGREAREAENMDQQRADAEAWAKGAFNMKLEELYLYEETVLPRIVREYEGFDENEYYSNLAENNGYDTTRESESIGRGGELLQGEQPVPAGGTPVVGQRNEGGAVSDDVQGGSQNGVAQEEVPVNEPVGNSEQLSSSEIPNNQSVAEGDAPGNGSVLLSDEVDENGRQFVLNSKGEIAFGEILEDSGLTPAPILLSEGLITNPATNDGYGLVHIEARHGDQIRNAGYSSVVEFVEEVAKNYEVIREGKDRNGQQTYMLQLTDKHNNTLMVELSGDGTYWNINTAGIFKTSYGKNRKEVYNRHTTAKQPTETVEASQDAEQSGTQATSSMNAPTTSSANEDRNSVSNSQENAQKSGEIAENGGEKKSSIIEEAEAEYRNNPLYGVQFSIDADAYNNEDVTFGESEQSTEGGALVSYQDVIYKGQTIGWVKETQSGRMFAPMVTSFYVPLENATEEDKRSPHYFEGEEDYMRFATLQQMVDYINSKPQQGEIQETAFLETPLDNGDKKITGFNSRGEVATVTIERDGKIVSVDSYDEGVLFEHTEYDGNGKATSVTRYDKSGNVVGTQKYVNGIESKAYVRETMRTAPLRGRAEEWMKDTGVPVRLIGIGDEITNREAREAINAGEKVTGWIDNNEVVLYLPNIKDVKEIDDTFVHEVVAHKGLKALMGEDFDALCDKVWEMMSEEQRAKFINYPGVNGDTRKAADEYMAHLAEGVDLTDADKTVWQRIVEAVREFLVKHGMKMTDGDIENLIRASYSKLKTESGKGKGAENDAQPAAKQAKAEKYRKMREDLEGLGVFGEVDLPKGYKWSDGKKYGGKSGRKKDASSITALVIGDDLYLRDNQKMGGIVPFVNLNNKNHQTAVIRNFRQWPSIGDFMTAVLDVGYQFDRVTEDAINEIFTQNGIGFNRSILRPMFRIAEVQAIEEADKVFNEELDAFKEKSHKGLLHLGSPMRILVSAGVNAEELTLSPTVLFKHLKKQSLTTDDLKGLAKAIQTPILVYEHGENYPNIVVVTELDVRGGKLSIALELDDAGNVVEVSNVSSVHSKDAVKELERLSVLDEKTLNRNLRWVEKEKVSEWLGLPYEEERQNANPKLISVANVINNFENPSIESENTLFRTTYHGSGAKFDRFDHAFMGTGEGAQAFGWGTYVTEVEGIGRSYAGVGVTKLGPLQAKLGNIDSAISSLEKEVQRAEKDLTSDNETARHIAAYTLDTASERRKALEEEKAAVEEEIKSYRNLYTVEIPDDNGSNYLHWDKPINGEIQERIANGLQSIGFEIEPGMNHLAYSRDGKIAVLNINAKGEDLYAELSDALGSDKAASLFLNDLGFVGISYPANATIGGRADGAMNYVIFNENDAQIKDRTMFRKKDSERRQEKRRINDAIDTAAGFITVGGKKQATKNRLKKEAERKQLAKEMYSSVLKGDFNDVTLSQIDKFIEDATPANPFGRRISQRLPQRMERALRQGARTNAVDALFSRICESTVPANERFSEAGRREIEERKKELLKGWAIATGNWHTDLKEFTDDTEPIGEGKDSKVYMSKDGNSVIKASKGKPFGKKFRPDIDNIPLFNDVFKNSRYEILGYGEIDGQFVRILKQDFIDFAESTPLTPEERKEYMGKLGFKPLNKDYTAFSNGEIVIADLQKSNIVKDAAGNISVIDADAKLHTKDVGGDYTYPPVEDDLPEQETRFRKGNRTLLGTHSITEDKLRKAIRMGGLANPSTAVFELGEEIPGEYGEITFVMPSSMVDKKTGRNTGAFAGDAWTPTYPQVERQMGKRGSARAREDVQSVPKEMQKEVRMGLDSWLDGREGAGLAYLFLQEEGLAPELSRVAQIYSDEIRNRVSEIAQGEPFYRLSPEQKQEIVDLFIEQYYNGDKAYYSNYLNEKLAMMQEKLADVNAKSFIKRSIQQYIDGVNEYGFDYEAVSDFLNKVQRDIDHSGGVNDRATTLEAARVIREKGLEREFQMWKEELLDRYEIKEVIFKGFTPTGNRRYVPHTLENVSKDMKEQGRNGAVGLNASFNKFAAGLLKPLGSLDAIRKRKGNLRATHADTEAFRDKWSEVYYDLAEKLQPDAKGYEDYGLDRVAEAATKKDPKAFIKSEYGIELPEADEKALKDMVWAIQNEYPVMYFETKFERPVYLDEFAGVVIPENTGSDVVESLENAGLKIETYEPGNEKARAEAIKRLTEEDDRIMFRITDADRQALEFKRQHKGSANIVAIDTDALVPELLAQGFTAEEIPEIRKMHEKGVLGFYDKMLPSFVQKYTKKWGAKVGEVIMPSLEENNTMWSVDVTPEMQESVMQGQTMFRKVGNTENNSIFASTYKTKDGKDINYTSERTEGYGVQDDGIGNSNSGSRRSTLQRQTDTGVPGVDSGLDAEKGEFCVVERVFTENGAFNFTSGEKIESADDVAYIFSALEDAAKEHSFVVYVKDGMPTVVELGMGSFNATMVDVPTASLAYSRINPDHVYFVHNHPSGNLICSSQDVAMLRVFEDMSDVPVTGVIINLKTGKYGTFDTERHSVIGEKRVPEKEERLAVHTLDKQIFAPDYDPMAQPLVRGSQDVAQFLNSQRMGDRPKVSFLILSRANRIIGNIHTPFTNITTDVKAVARYINERVIQFGGENAILYGDFAITSVEGIDFRLLQNAMDRFGKTKLLDVVRVEGNFTRSANDMGLLYEPEAEYKDGQTMFRFIGEKGAANLDKAEEATTRLDNLAVAREMETAGKEAKAIKLATGWERGADGKWRYETEDVKLNRAAELFSLENYQSYPIAESLDKGRVDFNGTIKLADLVNDEELFKAYPGMEEYYVSFEEMSANVKGEHDAANTMIRINKDDISELESTLVHEIQHAIQSAEGFAKGSSPGQFRNIDFYDIPSASIHDMYNIRRNADELIENGKYKYLRNAIKNVFNEYRQRGWLSPKTIEAFELNVEGEDWGVDSFVSTTMSYSADELNDYSINEDWRNKDMYMRTAGEVESRNVQNRMGLTPEERRESLAEETEDVARKDQIFIYDALESAMMGSRVDARMAEVAAHFEGKQLTAEQQAVVDVFGGKADNLTISVKTKDGNERRVVMRQGNEMGAGAKHSLFRHFGMNNGAITADDILLIPEILANGERVEKKRGKKTVIEYKYTDNNGVEYTVITENNKGREEFANFYTNRKASSAARKTRSEEARDTADDASEDKGSDNSSNTQEGETGFRTVEDVVERQEEKEMDLAREAVTSLGEKLKSPVKIMDDIHSVPENRRKWKGWFDPKTGEVVVVMPNHVSTEDAVQTVLHEIVAHKGLRAVLGEDFDGFLDGVYKNASPKVKRGINDKFLNALRNGPALTVREATEEYIAGLAERDFEGHKDSWNAIKQWFRNFFRNFMNMEITDGELRYLLWKNYNRMKSGPVEAILDRAMEANTGTGKVMARTAETYSAVDAYNKSVKGFKNKVKEGWYDEMRSLKKAQEAIEKELGREIMDSENVYLYANHIPSINKNKKEVFDNKYLRPFTSLLKQLYGKEVNGKKLDEKSLERYTNAKHGIERNREMSVKNALTEVQDGKKVFNEKAYKSWAQERDEVIERNLPWAEEQRELDKVAEKYGAKIRDYSGLTAIFDTEKKLRYKKIADAAYQYVADVEKALGDDVNKLWGLLKGMTDYSLNEAFESGMMSKSTYEHIKQMYRYYVPLRGFTEETAEDFFDYVEGDHSPLNAVVKTAYGRKSEADNIFATILNMANSAIVQGSKNRLKQRLLNLAMRSQTGLLNVDNAWYAKNGDTFTPVEYPENVDEYADFEERMKELEKNGEVLRHRPGLEIGKKVAQKWNEIQHAVRVKRNGREYVVWVNGDPTMANAINGLLREEIGGTIKNVNQFRSKMVTQYSPTFVFTNLLRDVQSASIIYAVRRGTTMLKNFEKNVASNATDMLDLYLKHKKGTLDNNNPKERYFKEFLGNGGETGYTEMISIEEYEKQLKKLTKGLNMKNGTGRAFEAVVGAVDFANRCIENLCRFSAYQTSREAGISVLKSIEDAKEVSVNFNRKGSGAMGQKYAKAGFMFLNPAVQSIAQRILLTKKYPKKMAAVWAGEFILGAAMPVLYSIVSAALGDDDDEITGNYYNLSDYRRRSSLCLPLKDGVFHIPLSHESRVLFGLGELCTSLVMGHEKPEDAPIEALNTLAQSLPLNPVEGWMPGKNIIETAVYNFMPDAAKPVAEAVMNRDFAGSTIHNRTDFNEFMPEYMRGKRGTFGVYKTISKYLTSTTDGYEKSFLNDTFGAVLNPSVMEHLLEGYLGGPYTFVEKVAKTGAWAFGNEEYAEFRNIPIASSFYTSLAKYENTPKEERTRRDWENAFRFYKDEVKGYDDKEKTAKNAMKYGEEGAYLTLEQMERNGEILMVDIFNDGNDRLKELYGASDAARKNGDFERVEEIDQQIYAEKRNIVSQMEQLANDPMIGYTFKRNKIEGPYGERETYGDVRDAKIINDIQKELKPLYEAYKDAYDWGDNTKEEDLWYELDDIERDISDAKSEMKDYPEEADKLMAEIRELRAKAMELINNYRKDE